MELCNSIFSGRRPRLFFAAQVRLSNPWTAVRVSVGVGSLYAAVLSGPDLAVFLGACSGLSR